MANSPLYDISTLSPGDHLCCIYQTEQEHRAVLSPYVKNDLGPPRSSRLRSSDRFWEKLLLKEEREGVKEVFRRNFVGYFKGIHSDYQKVLNDRFDERVHKVNHHISQRLQSILSETALMQRMY